MKKILLLLGAIASFNAFAAAADGVTTYLNVYNHSNTSRSFLIASSIHWNCSVNGVMQLPCNAGQTFTVAPNSYQQVAFFQEGDLDANVLFQTDRGEAFGIWTNVGVMEKNTTSPYPNINWLLDHTSALLSIYPIHGFYGDDGNIYVSSNTPNIATHEQVKSITTNQKYQNQTWTSIDLYDTPQNYPKGTYVSDCNIDSFSADGILHAHCWQSLTDANYHTDAYYASYDLYKSMFTNISYDTSMCKPNTPLSSYQGYIYCSDISDFMNPVPEVVNNSSAQDFRVISFDKQDLTIKPSDKYGHYDDGRIRTVMSNPPISINYASSCAPNSRVIIKDKEKPTSGDQYLLVCEAPNAVKSGSPVTKSAPPVSQTATRFW